MTALPVCASACITAAIDANSCGYDVACYCRSSSYINEFYTCINELCSTADQKIWISRAEQDCSAVGATFPSRAPSVSTAVSTKGAATATKTAPSVQSNTIASSAILSELFGSSSTSSPDTSNIPLSTSPADKNNGLGTGAKIGIAVGAVVIACLAIAGAFWLWYRNHHRGRAIIPDNAPVQQDGAATREAKLEQQATPATTTTNIIVAHELSGEQASFESRYKNPGLTPGLAQERSPIDSPYPLSSTLSYAEVATAVPLETDNSRYPGSGYSAPRDGVAEVDATAISHNAIHTTVPELEQPSHSAYPPYPSHGIYYELPCSPVSSQLVSSIPPRELSSPSYPAYAPGPSVESPSEPLPFSQNRSGEEDAELSRLKAEMEALRAEREWVQQLQDIETKERELSRKIIQRELQSLRRGTGGE